MPLDLWNLALFGEAPVAIQNVQCALDLAEVLVAVRERAQDVRTTTEPVGRLEGNERVPMATLLVEVLSGDEHLSRARILLTRPLRHGGAGQNHAQQESGNHSSQGFSRPSGQRPTSLRSPLRARPSSVRERVLTWRVQQRYSWQASAWVRASARQPGVRPERPARARASRRERVPTPAARLRPERPAPPVREESPLATPPERALGSHPASCSQ